MLGCVICESLHFDHKRAKSLYSESGDTEFYNI